MHRWQLFAALCMLGIGVHAQTLPPRAAWHEAGHVVLGMTEPAMGLSGAWEFDRADNGDMRIVKKEQRGADKVSGSLMVICDDAAMLTRNLKPPRGREGTELDDPILYLQLTLRLLQRIVPEGPQALSSEREIDFREPTAPIRVSRGTSAAREFLGPWRVSGRLTPLEPGKIKFEMKFGYHTIGAKDRQFAMGMVGVWQKQSAIKAFTNELPISDWQIYRIDATARNMGGAAIAERYMTPFEGRVQKLGDLRALIERDWDAQGATRKREECRL